MQGTLVNNLRKQNNSCAVIVDKEISSYRLHSHSYFEFEFVINGSITHILNGTTFTFKKGDLCLLSPSSVHQFLESDGKEPIHLYTLSFDTNIIPSLIWEAVDVTQIPLTVHLEGDDFISVKNTFKMLLSWSDNGFLPSTTVVKTALEWLILSSFYSPSVKSLPQSSRIQPALIYIQNNFTKNITIDEVASSIYLSAAYFSEIFRKIMGQSYIEYLLELRLSFAAELLSFPDITITDVCYRSGFRTPAYFSRAFKKYYGMSPEEFKRDKLTFIK